MEQETKERKEVKKHVKKHNGKRTKEEVKTKYIGLRILGIAIIIAVAIGIAFVIRNFFILNTYAAVMEAYSTHSNYSIKRTTYSGDSSTSISTFCKDGIVLNEIQAIQQEKRKMIDYYDAQTKEHILKINSDDHKVAIISTIEDPKNIPNGRIYSAFGEMEEWNNFLLAFITSVTTEECNGRECYKVNLQGMKVWIDKETYLTVRTTNGTYQDETGKHEVVTNYQYDFGNVTNAQVARPDLTDCQIQQQNA